MTNTILSQANRAAAGIRPVVTVPGAARPKPHSAIRGKKAADTLKALATMHQRRRGTGTPGVGGGVHIDSRLLAGGGRIGTVAAGLRGAPIVGTLIHRDPHGPDPEALMTGAILGQFIVENDAGRTAMARAIVAQVKSANARNGMDGLLLSALIHLETVNDPARGDALAVWRGTIGSAGSPEAGDSGVVIDGPGGRIGSIGRLVLNDPFAGGLARPAVVNHMEQLHGGDVMVGNLAIAAGIILSGAAKGAYKGYKDGGFEGAVRGGFEGAGTAAFDVVKEIGGFIGTIFDIIVGWVTSENDDAKQAQQDAKEAVSEGKEPPKQDTPTKDIDNAPPPPKDDGTGGGTGGDPDPVPPPSSGFPAPDDGSGNPWSLIGYGPMVMVRDVQAMLANGPAGAIAFARVPGLDLMRTAFSPAQPVLTQAMQLTDKATRLDATRLSALDLAAKSFDAAIGRIGLTATPAAAAGR